MSSPAADELAAGDGVRILGRRLDYWRPHTRALGTMLTKVGGATERGRQQPFLDAAEWAALKQICAR